MSKPPSAFELHRIAYINFLMERIHDRANDLYENLMDEDFKCAREDVKEMMAMLKDVEDSLNEVSEPR